jgi:hypothetical protein
VILFIGKRHSWSRRTVSNHGSTMAHTSGVSASNNALTRLTRRERRDADAASVSTNSTTNIAIILHGNSGVGPLHSAVLLHREWSALLHRYWSALLHRYWRALLHRYWSAPSHCYATIHRNLSRTMVCLHTNRIAMLCYAFCYIAVLYPIFGQQLLD